MTDEEMNNEENEVNEENNGENNGETEIIEEGLPFATAPIVRIMREELDDDKMIRSRVKREMNLWLGDICKKISRKMNESEYTMVALDDFRTAIEPYELIDEVEEERKRIIIHLERIKEDCDSLIRDVERKFVV